MWEEKRGNKYKFIEQYIDPVTKKKKRVSITLEKHNQQARRYASTYLAQKIAQKIAKKQIKEKRNNQQCSLRDLIDAYLTEQKCLYKDSTVRRNANICGFIADILGEDTIVEDLNAKYVKACFLHTQKSPRTLNEYRKRFKALINWGYKNDIITDVTWLQKFDKFYDEKQTNICESYLEPEELQYVLNNISMFYWHDLTLFLVLSGLRLGEAIALDINDVDIKQRIIFVNSTYDEKLNIRTGPKTVNSYREVFIQNELLEICKIILQRRERYFNDANERAFFINYTTERRITANAYRKALKEVTGLDKTLHPHMLRHTHASFLATEGVDPELIARRLGHSTSQITKQIYLHITNKQREKDRKELEYVCLANKKSEN